jgi:hypothetical protein
MAVMPDPYRPPQVTPDPAPTRLSETASARRRKKKKPRRTTAPRPVAPRAPKPPVQTPYNPFAPMYTTLEAMQGAAQRQAQDQVNAGLGALPTEVSLRQRNNQQVADIGELSAALNRMLTSNQQGAAASAAATPGLAAGAFGQATQGSNAMLANLGAAPTGPQGLGVVGQMGADMAGALQGGVQAAAMRGTLDQTAARRELGDMLTERALKATEIRAQQPVLQNEAYNNILDRSFAQSAAGDNSLLAWESLGLDKTKATQDYQLGQSKLRQDAAMDAANLGLKRDSLTSLNAYRAAQIDQARQKIAIDLRKVEQAAAKGGLTQQAAEQKRRDAITKQATSLVQNLRKQTSGGASGGTQQTGQTEYSFQVGWSTPPAFPGEPPKPGGDSVTITAASPEEAAQKAREAFAQYGESVRVTQTGATPITSKTPGAAKTRAYTDDQIRGEIFKLYRSYNVPTAEARRRAMRLVPKGGPARNPFG